MRWRVVNDPGDVNEGVLDTRKAAGDVGLFLDIDLEVGRPKDASSIILRR